MARTSVNLRKQDRTEAALAVAVDYAVQVADGYLIWMSQVPGLIGPDPARPLSGTRILELGPGATLGTAVLLACSGARMTVADRFLSVWDPDFHPAFFNALLEAVSTKKTVCAEPIRAVLRAGRFDAAIECSPVAAEQLHTIAGTFDIVLSNAVLEHIEDLGTTVNNLSRKTAARGYGFHQVDLRDHRSFDRPLEYLTLGEQEFEELRRGVLCECGGQWRASDYREAFERAGFSVRVTPNMHADPAYLANLRPRLSPEFSSLSEADLTTISALFVLRRER
jgi:hypothetical protein